MSTILDFEDFKDSTKYYFIPVRFDENDDRLKGLLALAESEFCSFFKIKEIEIDNEEKKEALKYFTFSVWQKSEFSQKTMQGTGVLPALVKGETMYDAQKEIYCVNFAIRTMNNFLPKEKQKSELKPILNY